MRVRQLPRFILEANERISPIVYIIICNVIYCVIKICNTIIIAYM